jgi:hypothetical protein
MAELRNTPIEIRRDRARLRQARKRQRDRKARLALRADAIAERMPPEWRADWFKRVARNDTGKERARIELEKMLAFIPAEHRSEFLGNNRRHVKLSLPELRNRFVREKQKAEQAVLQEEQAVLQEEGQKAGQGDDQYWAEKYDEHHKTGLMLQDCDVEGGLLHPRLIPIFRLHRPEWEVRWTFALSGQGGILDKRVHSDRPFNPFAMDWLRQAKRLKHASVCHGTCVTSRPEYFLVAARHPPLRIFP